jgi:hypothetical protein
MNVVCLSAACLASSCAAAPQLCSLPEGGNRKSIQASIPTHAWPVEKTNGTYEKEVKGLSIRVCYGEYYTIKVSKYL